MDTIIKGLADLLLVGGTVGGYAMITIILLIVGYFKYLKPFLSDFEKIQRTIDNFVSSHSKLTHLSASIEEKIEHVVTNSQSEHSLLRKDINVEHREHHLEVLNLVKQLNKEIDELHRKSDVILRKLDENQKEITIEMAKSQTRLEYMNQGVGVRGIQK